MKKIKKTNKAIIFKEFFNHPILFQFLLIFLIEYKTKLLKLFEQSLDRIFRRSEQFHLSFLYLSSMKISFTLKIIFHVKTICNHKPTFINIFSEENCLTSVESLKLFNNCLNSCLSFETENNIHLLIRIISVSISS